MAPKSCVYCSGELKVHGKAQKGRDGVIRRRFRCKLCNKIQTKKLDADDPWAMGAQPEPKKEPRKRGKITSHRSPPSKLPAILANAKPTPRSLAAHHYQKKLAAHYAPQILPATFEAMRSGVEVGNATVIKMVLELYELVQTDKRISIVNDNRTVTVNAGGERGDGGGSSQRRSFESIARQLEAGRDKRLVEGNPLASKAIDIFAETPEGVSK